MKNGLGIQFNGKEMIEIKIIIRLSIPILKQGIPPQWFSHNRLRGINVKRAIKVTINLKNSETPCVDLRTFWFHHNEIWLGIYNFKELSTETL